MKRKVVKHGISTLTISLPSRWVKEYGIDQGDELEITDEKGKLVISTSKDIKTQTTGAVDLEEWGSLGKRIISSLFKYGCDVINVSYKDPARISEIEYILNQMIGFEIMHQGEKNCVIKEVGSLAKVEEFDEVIKRTFILSISLAQDYLNYIKAKENKEMLKKLINRDQSINKFCSFCKRIMNKKGMDKIKHLPLNYYIIEEIENICDEYKYIGKTLLESKSVQQSVVLIKIFEATSNMLNDFYHAYFRFSKDQMLKIYEKGKQNMNDIHSSFSQAKNANEIIILNHLSKIARDIVKMTGPLTIMKVPDLCIKEK